MEGFGAHDKGQEMVVRLVHLQLLVHHYRLGAGSETSETRQEEEGRDYGGRIRVRR